MLTIKAPIEIKAKTTYMSDTEAFYHRITGNYSLMETSIEEEDLLHLTATPPEIYVDESGDMTSILYHSERNVNNLNKVEILNNVLNRIVVSADAHMTYQDRVFITDALYKLGIKDDRRFMSAFYRMAEETQNTNTLINMYLDRADALKEFMESIETRTEKTSDHDTLTLSEEHTNTLYNNVLERLQTGAIYQIVSNFNRSTSENKIDHREYTLAGQTYTAQQILLSVLRERAGMGKDTFVYRNENEYEERLEEGDLSITNVKNEITSAVLMDLLQNIYHIGYEKFALNKNQYYSFQDAFYQSSLQVLQRLQEYQSAPVNVTNRQRNYLQENNRITSSEINLIDQIFRDDFYEIYNDIQELMIRQEEEGRREEFSPGIQEENIPSQRRQRISESEPKTEEMDLVHTTAGEPSEETVREVTQITNSLEDLQRRKDELRRQYLEKYEHTTKETEERITSELELITHETVSSEMIDKTPEQAGVSESVITQLTRQLEDLRTRKEELQTRYLKEYEKTTENVTTETNIQNEILTHKVREETEAKEEGGSTPVKSEILEITKDLRRLEEQERELQRQYETEYEKTIERRTIEEGRKPSAAPVNTPPETEHINSEGKAQITDAELEQITRNVNILNVQNEERRKQYIKVLQQIRERRMESQFGDTMEKTRRDAALALTEPEKLIERLTEEQQITEIREREILEEMMNVFPEETRHIYELLNNYRENSVELIENNILRPADMGELIYDVNEVEKETSVKPEDQPVKRSEVETIVEQVRRSEGEPKVSRPNTKAPLTAAETVHRMTQSITSEDLEEQLSMMERNLSTKVQKDITTEVVTENRHTNSRIEQINETSEQQLKQTDIRRMIENGVRNEMNAISNQVFQRLESQMRNEKIRRGY